SCVRTSITVGQTTESSRRTRLSRPMRARRRKTNLGRPTRVHRRKTNLGRPTRVRQWWHRKTGDILKPDAWSDAHSICGNSLRMLALAPRSLVARIERSEIQVVPDVAALHPGCGLGTVTTLPPWANRSHGSKRTATMALPGAGSRVIDPVSGVSETWPQG